MSTPILIGLIVAFYAVGRAVGRYDRAKARARIVGAAYAEGWVGAVQNIEDQLTQQAAELPPMPAGLTTTPERWHGQLHAARQGWQ